MTRFTYSSEIECSAHELFEFHANVANLPAISPPFPPFRLLSEPKVAEVGDEQRFRVGWARFGSTWTARMGAVIPDRLTEDVLIRGPFRRWRHRHRFADSTVGKATLTDDVSFRLLPTPAGEFIEYFTVRPMLLLMFRFRHRRTSALLEHHKS